MFMDCCLPIAVIQNKSGITTTILNTTILHGRAAYIISNLTASGTGAVKLEPNVCVVKSKTL